MVRMACMVTVALVSITAANPPERAALAKRAGELEQAGKLVEAERELLVAVAPLDAAPADLETCRLLDRLAAVRVGLFKFAEARAVLAPTLLALEGLAARQPKDPAVRRTLANAHGTASLCSFRAGRPDEGETSQGRAIQLLQALAEENLNDLPTMKQMCEALRLHGRQLMQLGRYTEAEATFSRAVNVARAFAARGRSMPERTELVVHALGDHALLLRESGRFMQSAAALRESVDLLKRLRTAHPNEPKFWRHLPEAHRNLAQPLEYAGDHEDAQAARQEAARAEALLASLPAHLRDPDVAGDQAVGCLVSGDFQRFAERQPDTERLLTAAQSMAKDHPTAPLYQSRLASAWLLMAGHHLLAGKPKEMREAGDYALAILTKLKAGSPDVPVYQVAYAEACTFLAGGMQTTGDRQGGEKRFQEGLRTLEQVSAQYPKVAAYRWQLSEAHSKGALLASSLGDHAEAARRMGVVLDHMKRLSEDFPDCPLYRRAAARAYVTNGTDLAKQGRVAEAEPMLREGLRLWARTAELFPATLEFALGHGDAQVALGYFLTAAERLKEAESALREAARLHQRLAADGLRDPRVYAVFADDQTRLGYLIQSQGRHADALVCHAEAVRWLEEAYKLAPRDRRRLTALKAGYERRANTFGALGRKAEAEADLLRVKELEDRQAPALLRISQARQRLAEGDVARATEAADDLFLDDLPRYEWGELASLYASISTALEDEVGKERAASRAVQALGKAVEGGSLDPASLTEDARFRALSGRPDFKSLTGTRRR